MKRRNKRLLTAGAAVVGVMALAGFAIIATGEDRPLINVLDSTWAVDATEVTPFQGSNALNVHLELKTGDGTINRTPDTFAAICESILGALPLEDGHPGPQEVFRVGINVISGGRLMFNQSMPVSVKDGACVEAASIEDHRYQYPGALAGWEVRNVNINVLDGHTLETSFEWTGESNPELDDFDYALACDALLTVPPTMVAAHLATGAITNAKIWSAKPIGEGRFTARSRMFQITQTECEAS